MSRHILRTTLKRRKVQIQLGLDRPTQEFYAFASYGEPGAGAKFLYDSLCDPDGRGESPDYHQRKLAEAGLTVPDSVIEAVVEDCCNNVVNCTTEWSIDGKILTGPTQT